MASKGSPEEQNQLLQAALQSVKTEAIQLQRCLDKGSLMDSIKHASKMISELRTSLLAPRRYFELYITLTNELQNFAMCLQEEFDVPGSKINDLYELVQYAGHIIPRLYLLVTVGTVFIRAHENRRKEILKDLVEMCRGVQHPVRGLFLRQYLLQSTKDLLPDCPKEESEGCGDIHDTLDFILLNFTEMNKLWVRMQHQTHSRDREKCEKERRELKQMVGSNLERLTQLDAVDVELYKKTILPCLMEQIVNCRDCIAQEYLMECIIQVFPDEFHLQSLHMVLKGCAQLHPKVNVKNILNSLIDRLATYSIEFKDEIPDDVQLFDIFSAHVTDVINARPDMPIEDVISLQMSLTNLALKCFPDQVSYVDKMLDYCSQVFVNRNLNSLEDNSPGSNQLIELCKLIINAYGNITTILDLSHYSDLWQFLSYDTRKSISIYVVNHILSNRELITTPEHVTILLDLISPLISDQEDQPEATEEMVNSGDFSEEQNLVASLVHSFVSEDVQVQYSILIAIRKKFGTGGEFRIKYSLPALVFGALKLARRCEKLKDQDEEWEKTVKKLFQFTHTTIKGLVRLPSEEYDLAFRLSLNAAAVFDKLNFEQLAYESMATSLIIYENNISDSKKQIDALNLYIGTLQQTTNFCVENFDPLSTKAALHASRLLQKKDQCRSVALSSHLFWSGKKKETDGEEQRDGARVLECLQKCLKIADMCLASGQMDDDCLNIRLFVEILSHYLYYYENNNESIKIVYLDGLIELIKSNLESATENDGYQAIKTHFDNILAYIQQKKDEGVEKFQLITL